MTTSEKELLKRFMTVALDLAGISDALVEELQKTIFEQGAVAVPDRQVLITSALKARAEFNAVCSEILQ
jgi:hypothetical protein